MAEEAFTNGESQDFEEEAAAILQEEATTAARLSEQLIYGYQYS